MPNPNPATTSRRAASPAREDRDNRGNRDTSNRGKRTVTLDDDFGNRIPPVKAPRGIRARIAAGDIDEELDNIGNRMPPPPKHLRHADDEDEVNFNVALPPPPPLADDDEGEQPLSNAGQMFPSSAGFMGELRSSRGNGHGNGNGNGATAATRRAAADNHKHNSSNASRSSASNNSVTDKRGAARGNGGGRSQERRRGGPH